MALSWCALNLDYKHDLPLSRWWPALSPQAARTILATIATAVVSMATVSFSITIVALTMASAQFGPRLLRNFIRSRANQTILGGLLGIFGYCLLIIRSIHEDGEGGGEFVPQLSLLIAMILAFAAIALLISFIHSVAVSIQAPQVIYRVSEELNDSVEENFPSRESMKDRTSLSWQPWNGEKKLITSGKDGYLQAVDLDSLVKIAEERNLQLEVPLRPGDFVRADRVLLTYREKNEPENGKRDWEEQLCKAFLIAAQRSPGQDFAYCVRQLEEVAIRALSPGVNDPFTAMACIDYLGAALCKVAKRSMPPCLFADTEGVPRLKLPEVKFEDILAGAVDQIRRHASSDLEVLETMMRTLAAVHEAVESPAERRAVFKQAEMVVSAVRCGSFVEGDDAALLKMHRSIIDSVPASQS